MEQYEKSGPPQETKAVEKNTDIKRLEQLVTEQSEHIKHLEKEINRIKNKMDAHAIIINQIKRG